ncbi:MAG: hypothetical protein J0I41_06490 [Filimonas sp.]|nr:hypothetical protein [Filimonas sp.]
MSLSPKWKEKQTEVAAFLETIKDTPDAPRAYTFTREQLEKMLTCNGKKLDGIRFYFGQKKDKKGKKQMTLVAVGCTKDAAGIFNDYNVPQAKKAGAMLMAAATDFQPADPTIPPSEDPEEPAPCPAICGATNILNP